MRPPVRPIASPRPSVRSALILLLVGLTGSGCGGEDSTSPQPDPLAITATVPAAGEQAADPFTPVSATFSEALDAATVTAAGFPIQTDGATLAAVPSWDAASRTVRIAAPLLPGTVYQAMVATTVRSSIGNLLEQAYSWTFTTRAWQVDGIGAKVHARRFALVRDASGTLHRLTPAPDGANTTLFYGVCSSNCGAPGAWQEVPLFTSGSIDGHSILIDGSGRRHILFQNGSSGRLYYGTCASACDTVGGWQLTLLILSATLEDGHDAAPVVLTPSGQLLVATISYTGTGFGVTLGGCASGCTNAANWQHILVAPEGQRPALGIDAGGTIHLAYRRQADSRLMYGRCASDCLAPASWQILDIGPASTASDIALITAGNGLHLLLNAGNEATYYDCASNCGAASSWTGVVIDGVAGSDGAVSLASSGAGRLHAFYSDRSQGRLKYATCTTDCKTAAGWRTGVVATGVDVRSVRTVLDAAEAPVAVADDYGAERLVLIR